MSVPSWWAFLLVGLAAFRTWRLLAEDSILDRPRDAMIRGREFMTCPWCSGFWVSLAWWAAWEVWPDGSLVVAVPFALSAIVGLVAANLDPD